MFTLAIPTWLFVTLVVISSLTLYGIIGGAIAAIYKKIFKRQIEADYSNWCPPEVLGIFWPVFLISFIVVGPPLISGVLIYEKLKGD